MLGLQSGIFAERGENSQRFAERFPVRDNAGIKCVYRMYFKNVQRSYAENPPQDES